MVRVATSLACGEVAWRWTYARHILNVLMRRAIVVVAAAACVSCSSPDHPATKIPQSQLHGTWRAIEYINPRATDSAGRWPLGRQPLAYLVYDPTGHVFFQAVAGQTASPDARGKWYNADSAALHELLAGAHAYFGTYHVSAAAGTVSHRIEGEIPPNQGTTEIAAPYRLNYDTLVLGRDSSAHWTFLRVRP